MNTRPTSTTPVEMRYGVRKAQRGAAGRRGPLPWVSRGSCGIVFRIQEDAVGSGRAASRRTVKSGPAARRGRSGHSKVAQGKFRPQHCQLNCDALLSLVSPLGGGSRFRVLEDLESDDCASGAAARQQKRALRQVSAATDKRVSCSRRQDDCASGAAARRQKRELRQVSATNKRVLLQEARRLCKWSSCTSTEESTSAGKCCY